MKINPDTNIINIPITLFGENGSLDINAALDTGASYIMIPWGVAEKLGYDPARSRKTIHITTASGTEKVPLITIKKINALGVSKENVLAVCHDMPPQTSIYALLGLSFLRGHTTTINLKEGEIKMK